MEKKKLKVGIYGITGCMGCQLNILLQHFTKMHMWWSRVAQATSIRGIY